MNSDVRTVFPIRAGPDRTSSPRSNLVQALIIAR